VLVSHRRDILARKELVRRLGLLQADDVGLQLRREALQIVMFQVKTESAMVNP
jgi:hypothetical protein